jgi:hypothetical protein
MRILDVEDGERIARQVSLMRRKAWDLDADFDWQAPIDPQLPLLPLAQIDRLFPGLASDERLALSQLFGIVIANIFSDAEQFLNKTREALWPDFQRLFVGYPELLELGTQFFDEERKHALMFQRYIDRWFAAAGLDPLRFRERQMRFSESWQHRVIHRNAARGGLSFWWIVLLAEEESPLIYKFLEEDAAAIEPLYLRIHRKHFEEEARHATFAYTAMAFLADRMPAWKKTVHRRSDIMLCQFLQWSFMAQAMRHQRRHMEESPEHPWVRTVGTAMRKVERLPKWHLFRVLFREPTLLSPFMNYRFHRNMVEMVQTRRLWSFPLPRVADFADSPVNSLP